MPSRRLQDWTVADLDMLIAEKVPEDSHLEYKGDFPVSKSRQGERDQWYAGCKNIGDTARFEISEELIGFANAGGGLLVLGMQKSLDAAHPNCASAVHALPECIRLADVLRLGCRDLVEPKVDDIEFRGLPTQEAGAGVVLIRVGQSRRRPHRHVKTKDCYIRRGESTVAMSIEEIRDLVLYSVTKEQRTEEMFKRRFAGLPSISRSITAFFSLSCVLVPLQEVRIPGVVRNDTLRHHDIRFWVHSQTNRGADRRYEAVLMGAEFNWRAMLRGIRSIAEDTGFTCIRELHEDGSIVFQTVCRYDNPGKLWVYIGWLVGAISNAMWASQLVRRAINFPDLTYGLQLKWESAGEPLDLRDENVIGRFSPKVVEFPRIPTRDISDFNEMVSICVNDICHLAEADYQHRITIEWPSPPMTAELEGC